MVLLSVKMYLKYRVSSNHYMQFYHLNSLGIFSGCIRVLII
jgi:hypothetical protein